MSIRKRENKNGATYQVYFSYIDRYGMHQTYRKGGFKKKKDAKKHEIIMKDKLANGNYVSCDYTFDDVWNMYKINNSLKKLSIQDYTCIYNKYFKDTLGRYKINAVDNFLIQNVFNELDLRKDTKIQYLKIVKNVMKYAYMNGLITTLPTFYIRFSNDDKPKEKNGNLNEDYFFEFLDYLRGCRSKNKVQIELACWISYYTGMRLGEILALNVSDLDFENNQINIDKNLAVDIETGELYTTTPKTKKSQNTVPMCKQLEEILKEYLKNHDNEILLSDDKGNYISRNSVSGIMCYFSKKTGHHINFHQFRHAMASRLFEHDISPKVAQRILRHSNINTTLNVYTHLKDDVANETISDVFDNDCAVKMSQEFSDRKVN